MTSEIKILGQILPSERVNFGLLWVQKTRFLEFSKIVQELLRACLRIVFGLKRPVFWVYFQLERLIIDSHSLLWGPADALNKEKYAGFLFNQTPGPF